MTDRVIVTIKKVFSNWWEKYFETLYGHGDELLPIYYYIENMNPFRDRQIARQTYRDTLAYLCNKEEGGSGVDCVQATSCYVSPSSVKYKWIWPDGMTDSVGSEEIRRRRGEEFQPVRGLYFWEVNEGRESFKIIPTKAYLAQILGLIRVRVCEWYLCYLYIYHLEERQRKSRGWLGRKWK